MAFQEQTIVWDERIGGFTSFQTYVPDTGFSLNNRHFTLGNGGAYEHNRNDVARGRFYGNTEPSEVEVIFNDSPSSIKSFRTIGYEGNGNWSTEVTTDQESVVTDESTIPVTRTVSGSISVDDFVNKEGKYFSYIRGYDTGYGQPDTSSLLLTGLGIGTVSGTSITVPYLPTDIRHQHTVSNDPVDPDLPNGVYPGDRLYFYGRLLGNIDTNTLFYAGEILTADYVNNTFTYGQPIPALGLVRIGLQVYRNDSPATIDVTFGTDFTDTTVWDRLPYEDSNNIVIEYEAPTLFGIANDDFFLTVKNESAEVSGLKGFYAIVKMSNDAPGMSELFSVSSEVTHSSG